ncbi:MAG: hypothetical protein U0559_08935 [Anaerolineae bacterium]
MSDIISKLNELSDIQSAVDVARVDYEAKRAEIMRTVQAELEALEAEYQPLFDASTERIATLAEEIKQAVMSAGASVKGAHLHAVYSKGRVTWDTKGLDKFAVSHPEVTQYRKQGEPTVSLRNVKED